MTEHKDHPFYEPDSELGDDGCPGPHGSCLVARAQFLDELPKQALEMIMRAVDLAMEIQSSPGWLGGYGHIHFDDNNYDFDMGVVQEKWAERPPSAKEIELARIWNVFGEPARVAIVRLWEERSYPDASPHWTL